jgi:integrase
VYLAREKRKVRKTFRKESEAKAWRSEAQTAANKGELRSPSKLTVEQAAWLWLEGARSGAVRDRRGKKYKPSTVRDYEKQWRLRLRSEFGALRLSALTSEHVQTFVDELLGRGLKASTIRNTLDPLRALYRHAIKRKLVSLNPTKELDVPAADGKRDRIADAKEATELLALLPSEDRPLWATAFYAGLRRSELRALRWSDIDLGRGEIRVERAWDECEGPIDPKSESGARTVPILTPLRDYLDSLKIRSGRGDDDLVFGRSATVPFAPSSVSRRGRTAFKDAKPITPHECRHTFASMMIDAGVNPKVIQKCMGHSSIKVTFDTYGHLMPDGLEQVREKVDVYLRRAIARAEAAADPCASDAPAASGTQRFAAPDPVEASSGFGLD